MISSLLGRPEKILKTIPPEEEDSLDNYSIYLWYKLPQLAKLYTIDFFEVPALREIMTSFLALPILKLIEIQKERRKGNREIKNEKNKEDEDKNSKMSFLEKLRKILKRPLLKKLCIDMIEFHCFQDPASELGILSFLVDFKKNFLLDLEKLSEDRDYLAYKSYDEYEDFEHFKKELDEMEKQIEMKYPLMYSFTLILGDLIKNGIQLESTSYSNLLSFFSRLGNLNTSENEHLSLFIYLFTSARKMIGCRKDSVFKSMSNLFIDAVYAIYTKGQGDGSNLKGQDASDKNNTKSFFISLKELINNPIFPHNNFEEYCHFLRVFFSVLENAPAKQEADTQFPQISQENLASANKASSSLDLLELEIPQHDSKSQEKGEEPQSVSDLIINICEQSYKLLEFMKEEKMSTNRGEKIQQISDFLGIVVDNLFTGIKMSKKNKEDMKDWEMKRKKVKLIFKNITFLMKGEFDSLTPDLLILFDLDPTMIDTLKETLTAFREIIKGPQQFLDNHLNKISEKILGSNLSDVQSIMRKVGGGEDLTMTELFNLFDKDKSHTISLQEFKILTRRLGIDLSDHRIKEIFTFVKIKAGTSKINAADPGLDQNEFELSINYIQTKSVLLSLRALGLNQEFLIALLIYLICMLLVIFAFIFIGVEAFAIAGTFGAIINSLFPIAGGAVLNNKNNNKYSEIFSSQELKSTVGKCVKIVQSMKI